MYRILGLILCLFLFTASPGFATEITGTVTDTETGQPIPYSHIELEGLERGDATDENGEFRFEDIYPGIYTISASCLGYKYLKATLNVHGEWVKIDFGLDPAIIQGQEATYTAHRAVAGKSPVAYTDVSGEQLRNDYWAQDIPPMLGSLPGVYSYSEMGEGIGYTHVKIRGFDTKRIGVSINNVPLNDPEDGNVYWVDTPDLVTNVADIQVQRGVGVTSHGTGAFGGSINLVTANPAQSEPQYETIFGSGSFNTRKWGLSYNSGMVDNKYGFYGRFSKIQTDGYRDNSGIEMYSYFLTGARYGTNHTTTLNVYGGKEMTHAAWYASSESAISANRKDNPYTYPNTIDDFSQPRYELHHEYYFNKNLNLTNTLYYVRGVGYYEQNKYDADLIDYGYQPFDDISSSDLVKQDWVKKNHVGWAPLLVWKHDRGTLTTGGDLQWFESDHYGLVLWGNTLPADSEPMHKYYNYAGKINSGGFFVREQYDWNHRLTLTGDFGLRYRWYNLQQDAVANFQGDDVNRFNVSDLFFDPKIGANFKLNQQMNLFGLLGVSHRPPRRLGVLGYLVQRWRLRTGSPVRHQHPHLPQWNRCRHRMERSKY
ncbi:TonB-dependent receptor [Calditrichota bacterium]